MKGEQYFRQIYEDHADMVFNLCLNYLQNKNDAEEVSQDVFVKVYQKLSKFQENSSIKTWIYRIAINQCLDFIKAKKRQKRFGFNISVFGNQDRQEIDLLSNFDHPGVQLEDKEALEILFSHINDLPAKQKSALILKSIEGLSQKEIAEVLKLSVKAVESLLSRAKSNLKKKLKSAEGNQIKNRQMR